jgi:hypothetical protein
VAASLDQARIGRDRLGARCLDRTLSEVHAVVRMVEETRRAVARLEPAERRHRARLLVVLRDRLSVLERRALRCEGGEEAVRRASGETIVEMTVSRDLPDVDPAEIPRPHVGPRPFGG